jgi:prepilin-type N-terminal cleavage/methylation domain-containing protein
MNKTLDPGGIKGGHDRAFTLIELLVVISVIGILPSLLLPALRPGSGLGLHEPPAKRWTFEAVNSYVHWHYARGPSDISQRQLKTDGQKFISTILFVDGMPRSMISPPGSKVILSTFTNGQRIGSGINQQ